MNYYRFPALLAAVFTAAAAVTVTSAEEDDTRIVRVSSASELNDALSSARAGDEIILSPGTYSNDKWMGKWAVFWAEADGTPDKPIVLRSEDPDDKAVLCGVTQEEKVVLDITGSYWEIRDLVICEGSKGIFLNKSEHSVISDCEVYNTGSEAVHIIDNSSYNLIENCFIHHAGTVSPQYGEGVYIGSSKNTDKYGHECHYNAVRGCTFGPEIAADHVDIKEYTLGNIVEYCTFDGTGIKGENGGDSFVEVKGNDCIVRYNTGRRNGCEKQLYAFDTAVLVDGWGQHNKFYDNTVYLDSEDIYVVKGWNCAAESCRNKVFPEGVKCYGNKVLDVLEYRLRGDVNGDGTVGRDDLEVLSRFLLGGDVPFISFENADICSDGSIDSFDLVGLRKMMGTEIPAAVMSVGFTQEDTGKWRMTDGLGGRTVTFRLKAESGNKANMGWGYWDPSAENSDTGKQGKWMQFSLGTIEFDETGCIEITKELPDNVTRADIEVYDYIGNSGKLDKNDVRLTEVLTG